MNRFALITAILLVGATLVASATTETRYQNVVKVDDPRVGGAMVLVMLGSEAKSLFNSADRDKCFPYNKPEALAIKSARSDKYCKQLLQDDRAVQIAGEASSYDIKDPLYDPTQNKLVKADEPSNFWCRWFTTVKLDSVTCGVPLN